MSARILNAVGLTLLLGCGLFVLFTITKTPPTEGEWMGHFARTSITETDESGLMHLTNVRDWTYGDKTILTKGWLNEVVHPDEITRAWFMLEPFPDWRAVGHTYLSFEFKDGTALSFSVEARIEEGKKYSAWKGLINEYVLTYTWGTERDFLLRRLLFLGHTVRMYPLAIDQQAAKELFLELTEKTNEIAAHPRFYNTLTANCTNVLAEFVNERYPGTIPYDISWNFPGSSDKFLIKEGFIKEGTGTDLATYRTDITSFATDDPLVFSHKLRQLLESEMIGF